jgi:nucleotide-binding universal stress UspA family protein
VLPEIRHAAGNPVNGSPATGDRPESSFEFVGNLRQRPRTDRTAACVLNGARRSFMITLKNILVPHDFSDTSDAAMQYAVTLARTFGAKLEVLHVSDKARFEMATEFPLGLDFSLEDAIREHLLKIMASRDFRELKPVFEVRTGTPYLEIVRYAKDRNVDLIVMGTHGRGFVAHAVMGSVAEKVVRHAPCPVLTVRYPHPEFFKVEATEPATGAVI